VADASANFTATWALFTGGISGGGTLSSVARTPLRRVSRLWDGETSFSFPLVLAAGALLEKSAYTVALSASTADGRSGVAYVSFSTSGHPTSGSLIITPSSGIAVVDAFAFAAADWTDDADAYPLLYSFYYVIGGDGGTEFLLRSGSYSATVTGISLPQGADGSGVLPVRIPLIRFLMIRSSA
jgi:hypothetical protein